MSYEGPKKSRPQSEQASPATRAPEPDALPGKQARTRHLSSSSAGSPAPVQQKRSAARATQAAQTARWLDTAMRPDLHPPPVQAKGEAAPAAAVQMSEDEEGSERRAGEAIPSDLRTRLFETLQSSTEIQGVLEEIREANGNLDFPIKWSSRGNYHSTGSIYLDLNRDEESWVASLAHELVHLSTYVRGQAADVSTNSREDFVRLKMEDEINSQATQYVALLQMGNTTATSAGYQDFRSHLQNDHADLLEDESWSQIKEVAQEWLEDKYRNEWVTSNSGANYYEYWGSYWDRNHED